MSLSSHPATTDGLRPTSAFVAATRLTSTSASATKRWPSWTGVAAVSYASVRQARGAAVAPERACFETSSGAALSPTVRSRLPSPRRVGQRSPGASAAGGRAAAPHPILWDVGEARDSRLLGQYL
jgi:hypothetical protein